VAVGNDLQKLTLDALATCIFGLEFDTLKGKTSEPLAAYNYAWETLGSPLRTFIPWINKLPFINKRLLYSIDLFDKFCLEIINQSKKKVQQQSQQQPPNEEIIGNKKKPKSIIELMIENELPDDVIRSNIAVFFWQDTKVLPPLYVGYFPSLSLILKSKKKPEQKSSRKYLTNTPRKTLRNFPI